MSGSELTPLHTWRMFRQWFLISCQLDATGMHLREGKWMAQSYYQPDYAYRDATPEECMLWEALNALRPRFEALEIQRLERQLAKTKDSIEHLRSGAAKQMDDGL